MLTIEHLEDILWIHPTTLDDVIDLTLQKDVICPHEAHLKNDGISRGYDKRG